LLNFESPPEVLIIHCGGNSLGCPFTYTKKTDLWCYFRNQNFIAKNKNSGHKFFHVKPVYAVVTVRHWI